MREISDINNYRDNSDDDDNGTIKLPEEDY